MALIKDLEILEKFEFQTPPVGVKFLTRQPDSPQRLGKKMALCEMLKLAQEGEDFWVDAESHTCEAGLYVLGQAEAPGPFIGGEFGAGLQIYEEPRAASRLYHHIPTIGREVVNYLSFSPIHKMSFSPDLMILLAEPSQTEILLRAMSYGTGEMWLSRYTPAIGCAWIFVYPYLSGELNYSVTGLGHGMKRRNLFPEGKQLISIPFDRLPGMLETLTRMPWVLPAYKEDGLEFVKNLLDKLGVGPPD